MAVTRDSGIVTSDMNVVANFAIQEGIEELMSSIRFYPNPVADKLYVVVEVEIDEIGVYDIYGRRQVTETPSHQGDLSVDVSELNSGIYFVKVKTENGNVVKRIVKY